MDRADVNGIELEYEVQGVGEPVLLIDMLLPDSVLPFLSEPALASRHQLIRYHKRGWVGSTHTPGPVTIGDHADDAAGLLAYLGVPQAHIVGHSSGAVIGAQLTLDHPEMVQSLTLLEPTFASLPEGQAFVKRTGPVFDAYGNGDHAGAIAMFVSAASGLDWETCRAVLEEHVHGVVNQATKDADTLFGIELPSLAIWELGVEQAAALERPTLSVIGANTGPMWVEIAEFLRASLPCVKEVAIDGVGHLLQMQHPEPVAQEIAAFLEQNPMRACKPH